MDFLTTFYGSNIPDPSVVTVRIITSGAAVAMLSSDFEVIINKTISGPTQVTLPPGPSVGQEAIVSDGKGDLDVGLNNITVVADVGTINGAANRVMQAAYQSLRFRYSGTEWNTIA